MKVKLSLFSFILGVLSLNVFSQGTPLSLPLSGNLDYNPPISFIYKSQVAIDTLSVYEPGNSTTGLPTYTNYVLNMTTNKVGIGTTSPKTKFHVNGDGLFSSRLTIGDSLISNGFNVKLQLGNTWAFSDLSRAKIMGYNCLFWNQDEQVKRITTIRGSSAVMMNQDGSVNLCTTPAPINPGRPEPVVWNYFTMLNNGNVGVGTDNPSKKLHVQGDTYLNGKVGIGTNNPTQALQIGDIWTFHNGGTKYIGRNITYDMSLNPPQNVRMEQGSTSLISFGDGSISLETAGSGAAGSVVTTTGRLTLTAAGNVGIGTTNTFGYKLAVNGTIGAKKVLVETNSAWPDYVFDAEYELRSLDEVAAFIEENKHLPEIPTANEINETGIDVAEINTILLKKVEELTLYILQQNRDIQSLKEEVHLLKERR